MIYKTLHINLTILAMYQAKWRQIQMGVRYLDISLFRGRSFLKAVTQGSSCFTTFIANVGLFEICTYIVKLNSQFFEKVTLKEAGSLEASS